mgnify:CR=1 FL=1
MDGKREHRRMKRGAGVEADSYGKRMPIARNEDVEFSLEEADAEDLEALARMEAADRRQLDGRE